VRIGPRCINHGFELCHRALTRKNDKYQFFIMSRRRRRRRHRCHPAHSLGKHSSSGSLKSDVGRIRKSYSSDIGRIRKTSHKSILVRPVLISLLRLHWQGRKTSDLFCSQARVFYATTRMGIQEATTTRTGKNASPSDLFNSISLGWTCPTQHGYLAHCSREKKSVRMTHNK
jgi:hypothetical protein